MKNIGILAMLAISSPTIAAIEPLALNFIVNGANRGSIEVPFDLDTSEVYIDQKSLDDLKINLKIDGSKKLKDIKDLEATFDDSSLSVTIKTDANLINSDQSFSMAGATKYEYSKPLNATYLNYSINHSKTANQLILEAGASNNGYQFHSLMNCMVTCIPSVYTFIKDDLNNLTKTQIGDFQTHEGDEILGIGFGKFYRANPFFVRQPTASFSGVAQSASKIEVFVDGVSQFSRKVEPGKFSVNDIRSFSGRRDLNIQITDAFGNVQNFSDELFSAQNLLEVGLSEYQFNIGMPRISQQEVGYNGLLASGFYRYGFNKNITAGLNFNLDKNIQTVGADLDFASSNGAVSSSHVKLSQNGDYSVSSSLTNTNKDNDVFWSINGIVSRATLQRAITEVDNSSFVSASVTKRFSKATVTAAVSNENRSGESLSKITVNTSFPLPTKLQSNFTTSSSIDDKGEYDVRIGLNFGFGAASTNFNKFGETVDLSLFKTALSPTDSAYRASVSKSRLSETVNVSANKGFQNLYAGANCQQTGGLLDCDATIAGSLLYSKQTGMMISRPIRDSFVVANVGAPDVVVGSNGRDFGSSNKDGYLLLPEISSYSYGQINLDPSSIKENLNSEKLNDRFLTQQYSGAMIDFDVKKINAVTGKINLKESVFLIVDSKIESFSGSDGSFYIDNISDGKHTMIFEKQNIKTGEITNYECKFETKGKDNEAIQDIGNIDCSIISK